jgi:GAF domain-containing protein
MAVIPIVGADRALGTIQLENFEREDAYGESEIRLLSTVAASMGVALESARNFSETQRLLKETEQRAAELAVINSIQQGIAAELKFQAIIDLVGDKLREVLKAPDISIDWHDSQANLLHHVYVYEKGARLYVDPSPPRPAGPWSRIIVSRRPEVANTRAALKASGVLTIPGTLEACASVTVPIIGADRVLGLVSLEHYERENVFGESEVRLLTTVAASMGVALENARLFDETQRLFKASRSASPSSPSSTASSRASPRSCTSRGSSTWWETSSATSFTPATSASACTIGCRTWCITSTSASTGNASACRRQP